jgi:imidazolonepropionase-like amidohydrolase
MGRSAAVRSVLLTALAFAIALAIPRAQAVREPSFVIKNVSIVSTTEPHVRVGSVLVRDGRIVYVGPSSGLREASGALAIDGTGRFLIPGLIDMHTHVSKTRGSSLALLVASGVTTVRDLGGDHEELLRWKKELLAGTRVGPTLLIAGPYLESATNADRQHKTPPAEMVEPVERTRIGVASPADAERIVAAIAARGVDHLKIRTTQDRETYLAIGAAARRHGLALFGHWQPYSVDDFFASGQRSVEHAFYPPLDKHSPAERRALFERMARDGIAYVPTLVVLERMATPDDQTLRRIVEAAEKPPNGRPMLSAFIRADWREQLAEQGSDRRPVYQQLQASTRRDLAEMRAASVRVLAGTDNGVLNVVPGQSLHEELVLLVRDAGMTPLEALAAATSSAAAFMGLERETGSIAAGKRADLVLLDANPLDDVARVGQIAGVAVRGRWFDRPALKRLVDAVAASPDVAANDWPRVPKR